jgi:hypothetical protein
MFHCGNGEKANLWSWKDLLSQAKRAKDKGLRRRSQRVRRTGERFAQFLRG